MSARHFKSQGRIVCGTGRRSVRPEATTNPFYVDCDCCRRTHVFRVARDAKRAAQEAKRARLRGAGFDPDKSVCDMTPEEVQAFIEWRRERKGA